MRDGIHKNAPLPQGWKTYIKYLLRPAEPTGTVAVMAERALVQELRRESALEALGKIWNSLKNHQLSMVEEPQVLGVGEKVGLGLFGRALAERAESILRKEGDLQNLFEGVVLEALKHVLDRRIRGAEGHIIAESSKLKIPLKESSLALERGRDATGKIELQRIADSLLSGKQIKMPDKPSLDLDEDLS